ncbi:MAG: hypothetical protein ED557_02935 [Balneola sp.]|nr:MAG: hypothetical protein ED557_02935 [Balneola sp.]
MKKITTLLLLCLCFGGTTVAQNSVPKGQNVANLANPSDKTDYRVGSEDAPTMDAVRITSGLIILDGLLDENAWRNAPVATGFTQRFPVDGGTPSQQTEAQILYTDKYIYVGVMAYETAIDSTTSPLFRRDGSETSDWVYVSFDSYNDKRTAFTFAVNPRGVQKDILYFDDNGEDVLWDAVWEAEAVTHANGWSVEMKIPLSQLRFSSKDVNQSWGVNFQRRIARHNEFNYWAPTSQTEAGMVSLFGRLNGISDLKEPRRLEIAPYVSSRLTREPEQDPDDPYYDENAFNFGLGGDVKYGLTSDLTLTATINPDFGQVEADPSTINLSQFEIFFSERRPFFLEGNEIFRFGRTRTYNTAGNPNTFYSRRIGRSPQGNIDDFNMFNNESAFISDSLQSLYEDVPDQTNIAAAAKISGKTKSGWSIGLLNAYTLEETANFTVNQGNVLGQSTGSYAVEPATNYLVARVKKDINEGNTVAGGFLSAVNRNIGGTYFEDLLRESAYVTGADFEHNWNDREYVVSGTISRSQINGNTETIRVAQLAPQRYYQRVDSDELSIDSSKTSLEGFATELSLRKSSGDHFTGSVTYSEVSPGYETNDLGFQNRADYRALAFAFQYQETSPKKVQYWELWSYHLHGWNYDGDRIWQNYNIGGFTRFKNQWYLNANINTSFGRVSDRLTRGGPIMNYNSDYNFNFNMGTDRAKQVFVYTGQFHRRDVENEYDDYYWFGVTYRPTTFIQVSVEPEIGFELDEDQYVATIAREAGVFDEDQTFGNRYIFSDARSTRISTEIRLNWTFNPKMSLQTFVRPFIASSRFSNFGEFNDPGGFGFDRYGTDEGDLTDNGDGSYSVDIDRNGDDDFTFHRSDFTFRSIQGNAVFRWEYKPGSTFFLVWQQQRDGSISDGEFNFSRDFIDIFDPEPVNVFLVKFSYWFGS